MQESHWATSSPTTEAKSMFDLARLVGVEQVRHIIAITDEQKSELEQWAREEPLLAQRIEDCIRFRERVLLLFDKLLEREEQKERAA